MADHKYHKKMGAKKSHKSADYGAAMAATGGKVAKAMKRKKKKKSMSGGY